MRSARPPAEDGGVIHSASRPPGRAPSKPRNTARAAGNADQREPWAPSAGSTAMQPLQKQYGGPGTQTRRPPAPPFYVHTQEPEAGPPRVMCRPTVTAAEMRRPTCPSMDAGYTQCGPRIRRTIMQPERGGKLTSAATQRNPRTSRAGEQDRHRKTDTV